MLLGLLDNAARYGPPGQTVTVGAAAAPATSCSPTATASTDVTSRTVDTHALELRRKLEDDPARPRHLLTGRKAGHRLDG
jgi:hypothetical protein